MKLFIFKPNDWAYCGGAVIFAAERFEDIQAMVDAEVAKDEYFAQGGHIFLRDESSPLPENKKHCHSWVLALTFEIPMNTKPGLVFNDSNYS